MDYQRYAGLISRVKDYESQLDRQNLWWTVVAMVGKVNNQGIEPQLLESVSETQDKFDRLKSELIGSLAKKYLERVEVDLNLKAQAFIDILNRNLFERTADVGFLSTDQDLVDYLSFADFDKDKRLLMEQRLEEYVAKYSVYSDVVVLTPLLEVVARLNDRNTMTVSSSATLKEALSSDDYIESNTNIDVLQGEPKPLHFIQRVEKNGKVVGLVCLVFKLEDELQRIHKSLKEKGQNLNLTLFSEKKDVLFNSHGAQSVSTHEKDINALFELKSDRQDCFGLLAKASGYQGYQGLDWRSLVLEPVSQSFDLNLKDEGVQLDVLSKLFPADLYALNLEINTALLIVVLNGKISSLKNNVKAFLPVLDSFQEIGTQVSTIFSDSISHIHQVTHITMEQKAMFAARVSLDVMDRNLYERANDCRWWALNPVFREVLSNPAKKDYHEINDILHYINSLYTVYTLLFVFDNNGVVVAVSDPKQAKFIGMDLSKTKEVSSCLKLKTTQEYSVSSFDKTPLYNDDETYIYCAAIRDMKDTSNVVGGVGVVFDSTPEFEAILEDFLPRNFDKSKTQGAFSFYLDEKNVVVSASENNYGVIAGKNMSDSELDTKNFDSEQDVFGLTIRDVSYIAVKQTTAGYREYKNTDGYVNNIRCFVLVQS